MNLRDITEILTKIGETFVVTNETDAEIQDIIIDSRKAVQGALFIAIPGATVDGAEYIDSVVLAGANFIVTERPCNSAYEHVCWVQVSDVKKCLGHIANVWFGNPTGRLKVIGVTGTNGKTTMATIMTQALRGMGYSAGSVGTLGWEIDGVYTSLPNTTPDALTLFRIFSNMVSAGVTYCVIEVSSIAVIEGRINGVQFCAGIFSNLTQDHLDYHGSMAEYALAKARFFDMLPATAVVVVSADSEYSNLMIEHASHCHITTISESTDMQANIHYSIVSSLPLEFSIANTSITIPGLAGNFNAQNAALVFVCLQQLGFDDTTIGTALGVVRAPSGRMERVIEAPDRYVFVDYAHTPDALQKALETLADLRPKDAQIISVFGCGGDRDTTKRLLMGSVAATLSGKVIVTDDNPRTEDSAVISAAIIDGVPVSLRDRIVVIPDRRSAIRYALDSSKPDDIILIAGKGHEDYQIVGTTKHHFSDQEEVCTWATSRR